jgi:hypothetical protein
VASGKVARRTVVADVAALLDSPEFVDLIADLDEYGSPRGRKGYGTKALLGACLVKSLFGFATWTLVAALIAEHQGMQEALGGCPSVWAMYRFATKFRENRPALNACITACASSLRSHYPDMGRDVAIDASDMPAFANGQRYVRDGGPERERFSDPDASWGHRSAVSTRKGGGFYGYKIDLAVCTRTGLPLAWQTRTARHHESLFVSSLLDAVSARGFQPKTVALDRGYDYNRIYDETRERGCVPIIAIKKTRLAIPLTPIPYASPEWKRLYKGRAAAEREFGRLKTDYGLAPLRVRGLARVQLHADLTILARLALALARTQENRLLVA